MNTFHEQLLKDAAALREGQTIPAKIDESLTSANDVKLTEFQQKLIKDANSMRAEKPVMTVNTVEEKLPEIQKPDTSDESLKAIQLEKIDLVIADLIAQKSTFANSLKDFAPEDNDGRKARIEEIDELQNSILALKATRTAVENGDSPITATPEIKTVEKVLDFKAIANLRSQLSKAQKALEKNPDDLKIKVKIAEINEKLGK